MVAFDSLSLLELRIELAVSHGCAGEQHNPAGPAIEAVDDPQMPEVGLKDRSQARGRGIIAIRQGEQPSRFIDHQQAGIGPEQQCFRLEIQLV